MINYNGKHVLREFGNLSACNVLFKHNFKNELKKMMYCFFFLL